MATLSTQTKDILTILLVYFASRLVWLVKYPIFNDEAIYLRYGRVMATVPDQLWYSLSDSGKQPLVYWLYGIAMQIVRDPLMAGRIVTILLAAATPIACYLIGRAIADRKTGVIAAMMIVMAPLFVFFDRLALVDSVLAALFAWILVFLVQFEKNQTLQKSIVLGILVGISLWIKSTGFLFALVVCLGLVKKGWKPLFIFGVTALGIFLPLFLRPEYQHALTRASEYTYSVAEMLRNGLGHVPGNLLNAFLVYTGYVSPVVFISLFRKPNNSIAFAWLVPFFIILVFGKFVHGRYLLFTTVPLFILTAMYIAPRMWLVFLTLLPMSALSLLLIINTPAFFHLFGQWRVYGSEANQYIDGWSSGYGVGEAFRAINADREGMPAIIATRWDSGNPEDAMFVYAPSNPGITKKFLDSRLPEESRAVLQASKSMPVYFVTRKGQYGGFESILIPVGQFTKPYGNESVEVFRVKPL